MSRSSAYVDLKARDKTAPAFKSIQSRAAGAGSKISSLLGGALAAAGSYLGARAIVSGINELGNLSDVAQATSTSVDELTKSSNALQILGIRGASVESMARAFMFMEKNTGRSGMAGFYQTIEEIGKLPDAASRSEAAMAAFGRSGMMFLPLINAADEGTEALRGVVDLMPSIPQGAADAGDAASDAMKIMAENAKSIWLQGIGAICGWFDNNFTGGIRGAAMSAGNYIIYYAKVAVQEALKYYRRFTDFFERIGTWIGTTIGTVSAGGSFREAISAANQAWEDEAKAQDILFEELENRQDRQREKWIQDFRDTEAKIKKIDINYRKATESTKSRRQRLGEKDAPADTATAKAVNQIRNSLVMANTAQAATLAALGPSMQNETKKQTGYLAKIAKNTEKTADNTEDSTNALDTW